MQKIENVSGYQKFILNQLIKIRVFLHFLPELFRSKISVHHFFMFSKHLLFFLKKLQHNKFVKIGKNTRPDLYVPGFPSKAFFTACRKFMTFDQKIPCTTALISITSACPYNCEHCYQKHDIGKDCNIDLVVSVVKKLQDMGISFFNLEGGEPFLVFDRLLTVCQTIDDRSEIWINTTGYGVTLDKLQKLKQLNVTALMFSLHSVEPSDMNNFMKSESAWQTLEQAIDLCHQADIAVAFNSCLFKEDFYNGKFEKIMTKAKEFKAAIIQIIKPKPAGGWLESGVEQFCIKDINQVNKKVNLYNLSPKHHYYPAISAQILEESPEMFGCTAGGTDRFYLNAKGDVQPCEFVNISFGNINEEDFTKIYERMRKHFIKPGNAMLCENCSAQIKKIFLDQKLSSLPLDNELSKEIYQNWDRGKHTKLYKTIEDKMK